MYRGRKRRADKKAPQIRVNTISPGYMYVTRQPALETTADLDLVSRNTVLNEKVE